MPDMFISFSILQLILLFTFALFSSIYMSLIIKLPYKGDFVLKALPIICLSLLAFLYVPSTVGILLGIGFLFSAGGDVSLALRGEKYFLIGLGLFLVAHVFYAIVFSQDIRFSMTQLPWAVLWFALLLSMLVMLFPRLGAMKKPVLTYVAVIFIMVVLATFWQGQHNAMLLTGAVLFMLSDAMIAIDRFIKPLSWSRYFIMSTYYIGQLLILLAFIV